MLALVILLMLMTEEPEIIFHKARRNMTSQMMKDKFKFATTTVSTMTVITTTEEVVESTTTPPPTNLMPTTTVMIMNKSELEEHPIKEVLARKLVKVTDLKFKNPGKIVGLFLRESQLFYVAKSHGEIDVFNATTFEYLRSLHTEIALHRLDYFSDGKIAANEALNSSLNILDGEGRVIDVIPIDYQVSDLKVVGDQIFVLSRSNTTVYIYNKDLNLAQEVFSADAPNETCNFFYPTSSRIYLSCQFGIYEISLDSKVTQKTKVPNASYSLALLQHDNNLWAAVRGKAEFHVLSDKLELKERVYGTVNEAALWANAVVSDDLVYVLDYVINIVSVYNMKQV